LKSHRAVAIGSCASAIATIAAVVAIACDNFDALGTCFNRPCAADDGGAARDGNVSHDAMADSTATGGYRAAVMADGPVGYWRLGEPPGTLSAKDEIGAHDGLYQGTLTLGAPGATSDGDNAVHFSKGSVQLGDIFDFANGAPFSLEAWVLADTLDSIYRNLLYKEFIGQPYGGWGIMAADAPSDGNNGFSLVLTTVDGGGVSTDFVTVPPQQFFHMVVTFDGTSRCIVYLNGLQAGSTPCNVILPDTPEPLVFGANSEANGNFFIGTIDEVAIYDRVLSAEQAKMHYMAR
jgi:hypothetical protein